MKLTKINSEHITRAEQISLSQNFVVCCTRGSVSVLERATLRLIKKITSVSNVKMTLISPNEKWVVVLSRNETFYILSLENFDIKKYRITGKYPYIESPCGSTINGCWSFDGTSIFILIDNYTRHTSAVRKYFFNEKLETDITFVDMLDNKYHFCDIMSALEIKKYFILAIDREKQDQNRQDFYTLIKFDGESFTEHPFPEFEYYISPSYIDYNENTHRVTLIGDLGSSVSFEEINGKMCRVDNNLNTSFRCSIDDEETVVAILNAAGCECNDVSEIVQSSNKSVYYISCSKGLIVVDSETLDVVARIRIKHGVEKTVEFGSKYIGIATLDGLRVYEIL